MNDLITSVGRTAWWRALWQAAAAGPASPVLLALAGTNGAPLWSGTSRVLTDGLPPRTVIDVRADDDWIARPVAAAITSDADDWCRAA